MVTDGKRSSSASSDSTVQRTELGDPGSLTYRQVNTDELRRWRITKTYVTDPAARRAV